MENLFHKSIKFLYNYSMLKQQSQQHTKYPIQLPQSKLLLVAITWNLFGSLPPHNSLIDLINSPSFQPQPDIIFFGTQECQRSLCMSFCCQAKSQWQAMLVQAFPDYFLAVTQIMRGLHSAILIKQKLKEYYLLELKSQLKAGTCNLMGNKGAISIQLSVMGQNFQFINCHLAAHQGESQQRNITINRVIQELVRKDLHYQIIFLGDMNYRIGITKKQYEKMIQNKKNTDQQMMYSSMLDKDQLRNQIELTSNFLMKFQQGQITFPPTYKIGINDGVYNRQRIPGWTDRIFNRKSKKMTRISYTCQYQILGCDHRPVLAKYEKIVDEKAFAGEVEQFIGVKRGSFCQLI